MTDAVESNHANAGARELPRLPRLVRGTVPLHRQVYALLRSELAAGRWQVGDRLPTESELAEALDVSLITVRRAVGDLAREHFVERIAGKGTFAIEPPMERSLAAITSFTDEMKARGLDPRNRVVTFEIRTATPAASHHLGLPEGSSVYFLERVRSSGERAMIVEQVELPAHLFPGLDDFDGETTSLYSRLSAGYGIELTHGEEYIEPGLPTAHEAMLLGIPRSAPVLRLELISRMSDGTPVEYCHSALRGDAARYRIDVVRPGQTPPAPTTT